MKIRSYCEKDWQEMFRLYNLSAVADQVDKLFFVHYLLLNPNFDPRGVFILERDGKITGWTVCFIFRQNLDAWSNMADKLAGAGFIMMPAAFDPGDAELLIRTAEEYLCQQNCRSIRCGIPGYTLFPNGIAQEVYPMQHEAFVKSNYRIASYSHSMERSLENYVMPDEFKAQLAALAEENIFIKTGDLYDLVPLRKMFEGSSLRNWMHLISRKAEQDKLDEMIVVRRGEEAIGYCQYNYFGQLERVGPFGITDAMRGKGIGTIMIAKLFEVMHQCSIRRAWFASCAAERINFYQKNGLQVFRKKSIFSKDLKSE